MHMADARPSREPATPVLTDETCLRTLPGRRTRCATPERLGVLA
jgi:hypothetical protein